MYTDVHCYCFDTFLLLELICDCIYGLFDQVGQSRPLLQKIRQIKPLCDCWWTTIVQGHYHTGLTKELQRPDIWPNRISLRHKSIRKNSMTNMSTCLSMKSEGEWWYSCHIRRLTNSPCLIMDPTELLMCLGILSVRPVDKPKEKPILVNVDRVTLYPSELPNSSWLGPRVSTKKRKWAQTRYNLRTWTENYNLCSLGCVRTGSGC